MKRRRIARTPLVNTMAIAINQARCLSKEDVANQIGLVTLSLAQFDSRQAWLNMADTVNMSEAFARARIGSGPQADEVVLLAQQALHAAHQRHAESGAWALEANESEALHWLLRLHALQLGACSFGEFQYAMKSVERRTSQALAGNGPRGVVVVGEMREEVVA